MNRKITICTFALTTLLLTGCTQPNTQQPDQASSPEQAQSQGQAQTQEQSQTQAQTQNQAQTQAQAQTPASSQEISEEKAKEIALTHAGLSADQVTIIKSGIDTDNGKKYYDIEFYTTNQKEYDYEIDLYNGEILDYDYDAEYYPSSSETTEGNAISEADAKQIALAQIPGATEQNIRKFHSDYDNGKRHYEGKIYYEQTEYEFEIDASNGAILEWDVESIYCDVP